ncbi:NYN domain-containing protein [Ignatzschineria cameli]|uniref:NYN domain-containing protein n=1 Tax=Ignatzschineria cameli TaxID=2182793 RepID=UPI000D60A7AC|nr:NYN domain-containing protein [Ignatzschineria cameli]PWD83760.1 NYN domain-containing protein [Ignatzschineria cameli]
MLSYAILIDGGFAKHKLWDRRLKNVTNDSLLKLVELIQDSEHLKGGRLHRVYFYDSEPLSSETENPVSFEKINFAKTHVYTEAMDLLKELQRNPYWAFRKGELHMQGWALKGRIKRSDVVDGAVSITAEDIKPNISQKGVDMKIGLDMAALSLKAHVDVIVLVTGDSDLIPAMKFARIEGRQIFLVPLNHPIKDNMRYHTDVLLDIDPKSVVDVNKDIQCSADS